MEVVVLVENSLADKRLKAEFGLSLLVKCAGGKILFDTGASGLFVENAALLHEDLTAVDSCVISHAHYDHGGGLADFLGLNTTAPVYTGSGFDGQYYGNAGVKLPLLIEPLVHPLIRRSEKLSRYIGIDRRVLKKNKERVVVINGCHEILQNVYLISEILAEYQPAEGNKYLLEKKEGVLRDDRFDHELIMVIREDDGLVLFTGCGHKAIRNMVKTVHRRFENETIKAIIGGFHLALQPGKPGIAGKREDIEAMGRSFVDDGVKKVITGHCTGEEGCAIFAATLKEKYSPLATGLRYTV